MKYSLILLSKLTKFKQYESHYKCIFDSCSIMHTFITGHTQTAHVKVDSLFWVMASNQSAYKSNEGFTNNTNLNDLFAQYNVNKYEPAFPFAKTEQLRYVYEIGCNCDIDSLILNIQTRFPEMYSGITRLDYENIALYDPVDWMWYAHSQDWLWHLSKIQANLAWDLTLGNPNVKTGIIDTDFDITHPDLAGKIIPNYDPYDNVVYTCNVFHPHGTAVASYVAGETTEIGNTPNGQLASVGFNTTMVCYKAWSGNYLQRALHASSVMGVNVLTSSAGGWSYCPDQSGIHQLVVKEILDNGTTIIMPAGNGWNGTHNGSDLCPSFFPPNTLGAFFPLHPHYDERVIIISSTGINDQHAFGTGTHSHFKDVDLCSPGYQTMSAQPSQCGANQWPYYGSSSGTSFATPIVAGVAALMYSVNPCMTPAWCQDILKNTTDPIIDAASFPGIVGTGRVNAYKAVKEAQLAYSTSLDLYIKDRLEDFGNELYPYHWQADRDKSPDIWVRNQQDGFTNQQHQQPEYSSNSPVYVYVRVRNKSCVSATGNEILKLYWSKASSWSSWPQNWDGSQPTIGNEIGAINLGSLGAGKDTIIQFTWNILNPYIYQNWSTCLLARIENSSIDLITIYPGRLDDDVFFNNNIAMRNVTITDIFPGIAAPGIIEGIYYPHGKYMFVGNASSEQEFFDFKFSVPDDSTQRSILKEAEVKVIFDNDGWSIFHEHLLNNSDVKILGEREILMLKDTVYLNHVSFPSDKRVPIYIGFSFLVRELSEVNKFDYHIRQYLSSDSSLLGGVHYTVQRHERTPFMANAGSDKQIKLGESVNINANLINESAIYNWYDLNGTLIYHGTGFSVSPNITKKYRLEVVANSDGFKDYDEMEVQVKQYWIENISPNPASNQVCINYSTVQANSAYIMIMNQTATVSNNYIIDVNQSSININLSTYQTGIYTAILVCDGIAVDAKSLIVY